MTTSILQDVKHMLGLLPEETAFDSDIIHFVNGTFGTLTQLGVGPISGFQITDDTATWDDFSDDARLNAVKSYIFLCTKMLFNPPDTGFVLSSMERQKQEMEYRLNVVVDYG
jgi:hypothetical protein